MVTLADGHQVIGMVVLACDGLRSVAHPLCHNPEPRFSGRSSWRAVIDNAPSLVTSARLTVGEGKQFIASPTRNGWTYWAADVGLPEGANELLIDRKAFLSRSFAGWHPPIADLIDRTDEQQLVIADIYDSIPDRLVSGPVALLGDAAHPMTPDLGQGACQAIEDGVIVAECLARRPSQPVEALAEYQCHRLPRVRSLVRESRRIGALAVTHSTVLSVIRDIAVGHLPEWANGRLVARYASETSFLRTLPGGSHGRG